MGLPNEPQCGGLAEGAFDEAIFFRHHWRAKPLHVRGGARQFLGRDWTAADFDDAYAAAKAAGGASVKERANEVIFIENASAYNSDLAARARDLAAKFGAPQAWFDTIRTYAPAGGIGAHFDHSDNFVLQQEGVKDWSLASPEHLPPGEVERRMRNVPGVGSHPLPQSSTLHFILEPGDLLYIPLFWLHNGVSQADSLSLSLVCPAISLYAAVVPFLNQALKELSASHRPIPAMHRHLDDEERAAAEQRLKNATDVLLKAVATDDVRRLVHSLQARVTEMRS